MTVAVPPELKKDTFPVGEYPVTVAVHLLDEPTITVVGAQATAMLLETGVTLNAHVASSVSPMWSVTVRVTVRGDTVVAVGVQEIEVELDVEHPSGRFVQLYWYGFVPPVTTPLVASVVVVPTSIEWPIVDISGGTNSDAAETKVGSDEMIRQSAAKVSTMMTAVWCSFLIVTIK